ncbi:MAG: type II toxin-antitoxin system VapC family toxin [Candidatus Latescibacteria bacterium]|nr:type II toxin-antitoxin system VapC family toxin [Candidatus Latescibacterota bacterium]
MTKVIRIYADTSVFGGVFDDEFSDTSTLFFQQVRSGRFILVTSEVVNQELSSAPSQVKHFFDDILPYTEITDITIEALKLQKAYIKEGIVSENFLSDALHVALSTVSSCDGIVSWNFKHIVHFKKIPLYNAVNVLHGYNTIFIHSPLEVVSYED